MAAVLGVGLEEIDEFAKAAESARTRPEPRRLYSDGEIEELVQRRATELVAQQGFGEQVATQDT